MAAHAAASSERSRAAAAALPGIRDPWHHGLYAARAGSSHDAVVVAAAAVSSSAGVAAASVSHSSTSPSREPPRLIAHTADTTGRKGRSGRSDSVVFSAANLSATSLAEFAFDAPCWTGIDDDDKDCGDGAAQGQHAPSLAQVVAWRAKFASLLQPAPSTRLSGRAVRMLQKHKPSRGSGEDAHGGSTRSSSSSIDPRYEHWRPLCLLQWLHYVGRKELLLPSLHVLPSDLRDRIVLLLASLALPAPLLEDLFHCAPTLIQPQLATRAQLHTLLRAVLSSALLSPATVLLLDVTAAALPPERDERDDDGEHKVDGTIWMKQPQQRSLLASDTNYLSYLVSIPFQQLLQLPHCPISRSTVASLTCFLVLFPFRCVLMQLSAQSSRNALPSEFLPLCLFLLQRRPEYASMPPCVINRGSDGSDGGGSGATTVLHQAVLLSQPSERDQLVQLLLQLHPAACCVRDDSFGLLPLQLLVLRGSTPLSPELLELLSEGVPDGLRTITPETRENLLHLYCQRALLQPSLSRTATSKSAAETADDLSTLTFLCDELVGDLDETAADDSSSTSDGGALMDEDVDGFVPLMCLISSATSAAAASFAATAAATDVTLAAVRMLLERAPRAALHVSSQSGDSALSICAAHFTAARAPLFLELLNAAIHEAQRGGSSSSSNSSNDMSSLDAPLLPLLLHSLSQLQQYSMLPPFRNDDAEAQQGVLEVFRRVLALPASQKALQRPWTLNDLTLGGAGGGGAAHSSISGGRGSSILLFDDDGHNRWPIHRAAQLLQGWGDTGLQLLCALLAGESRAAAETQLAARDRSGLTALHLLAAQPRRPKGSLKLLLSLRPASATICCQLGRTPLAYLLSSGLSSLDGNAGSAHPAMTDHGDGNSNSNVEMMEEDLRTMLLLSPPGSLSLTHNPLHLLLGANEEVSPPAAAMMAAAANGSVDDEHGRSCIRIPDLAILRCLLDALPTCVADADARGRTALMLLCQLPQLALGQQNQQLMAVIALLLEHDPHALLRLAHDGSNALHLACHNTHAPTALLQLLSAHASATTTALPADWPMRRSTSIADNDDKDSTPILPPIFAMNDAKEWPAALYVRHHSPRDMAVLGALLPRISGAFTVHKDETAGARPPSLDCVWLLAGATSAVSSAPLPQPLSAAELEMFLDVAPLDARSITALCESSWLDEEMLRMLLLSSARRRKGDDSTDDDADGPRAFAAVVSGPNVSLPLLQLLVDAFPAERASAWSEGWPAVCSSSATSSDEESEAEQAQPEANEAVTLTAEIDGVTGSIVMALLTNPVVQTGPLSALPPLLDCVLQRCPQEVKKLSTGETNPLSSPPSLFSWMLSVQRKYSSSGSSGGGWLSMELVQVLMRHCPTVLSLPDNQGRVPLLAWLETLQANSPLQPLQLPAVAVAAATANASEDGSGADPDSVAAAVAAAAEAAATNLLNYLVSHTPAEAFLLRSRGPRGCSYALLALLQHPVPSKARHAELFALAALPRGHGGQVAVTTFAEEWLELLRSCLLPPSEADAVDQLLGALLDAMPELAEWTDKDTGGSLLHHAARAQRVRACETLVAAGVSKSLKDRSGATPLDLCMQTTTITNASSSSSASSESAACLAFFVNDVVNEAEQLRAQVARLTAERQALQDEVLLLRRRAATQTAAAAASTVASGASSMSNSPRRHHHLSHLHLPPLPQQLHHHHQRQHSHQHLHLRVQSEELSARSSALLTFESSTATGGWLGGAGGGSGGGGSGAASSSFAELQAENERLRAAAALQQRVGISTAAAARPSSPSASASAASTHSRSLSRAWSPMTERDVAEGANNNNNTRPNHRRGRSAVVAPAASSNSVDADPRDFEGTAAAAGTRGQPKRDSGCVVC